MKADNSRHTKTYSQGQVGYFIMRNKKVITDQEGENPLITQPLKDVEELNEKKKQAKSKKRKLEMFKECRAKLNSLIVDWKETLGKDEETSFGMLKESIERERMDQVLGRHGRRMLRMLILLREDNHKKTTGRQLLLRKLTV